MAEQGPLSGQVLGGKYLLGELLGEGGFGMVYAGQHLLLDRPQAIKLLLEHYFSRPKFRERFLREARMVAALDHPHIVHIDDFGMEEQASRAYLVMPFIGGGTFHDVLKKQRRPLEMEQVVSYVEQISSALEYAHHRGVVHLDLKPQNLLVHEDGRLLLSDFGLAHLLKQEMVEGGTSLGYGTPHYMAPEHIHGQPEKQSDVYALGVILYQMLVGRRPFEGSTPEAVMVKHLTELPPPLRELRPELPLELEVVVERALAKQVAQRYQSAGELVVAFKDALVRAREQARRAEEERVRKAREEEQARRAEEERVRRAREEERVRKAKDTVFAATELTTSAHQTPLPTEVAHSSKPPALRPDTMVAVKPAKPSASRRFVMLGLAGLVIVALASGIAWLTVYHASPTGGTHASPTGGIHASPTGGIHASPTGGIHASPAGSITEFPVPTAQSYPHGIAAGPDGNLWFAEQGGNKIGRISPSGTITEFPVPTAQSGPQGIAAGPDGNLWFTEGSGNKIGRISPSGTITEFPVPTAQSSPQGIAAGPDGNLWFAEQGGNKIGRITSGK